MYIVYLNGQESHGRFTKSKAEELAVRLIRMFPYLEIEVKKDDKI